MLVKSAATFRAPHRVSTTDDPSEILRFALDGRRKGFAIALATLVEVRGGAARALGSQVAVREDGLFCGYISGGCVEAAIAAEAMLALDAGRDAIVRLGKGSNTFDVVLPCGGGISVAIHCLKDTSAIEQTLLALSKRNHVTMRYDRESSSLSTGPANLAPGWSDQTFTTIFRPVPRLLVCGQSIEAEMTALIGSTAGYEVHAISDVRDFPASLVDQDTAIALLHHELDRDLDVLKIALVKSPFYIGALGSQRTHSQRVAALTLLGYLPSDISRVKAPIGIFEKARDASSIALSVMADIALALQTTR
jgi:xanthine dehydrogenase accessory factor